MDKTIEMQYKKSTKGTHVYENEDYNLSFYLPKLMLENPASAPQKITINIKA